MTEEQRAQILVLWRERRGPKLIHEALGAPPNVSVRSISHYCYVHLPRLTNGERHSGTKSRWTPAEDARLRKLWPTHGAKAIAKLLGRPSKDSVHVRAKKLGLEPRGHNKWQYHKEHERVVAFVESRGEVRADMLIEMRPPPPNMQSVLHKLARAGRIRRVRPGVFAALEASRATQPE